MHLPRALPELTKISSGFKVKIDIPQMEQFVLKEAYWSCAIVDVIFGLVYNVVFEFFLDLLFFVTVVHFFCKEVGVVVSMV